MSHAPVVATVDPQARTAVKSANNQVSNLPAYQAAHQHIPMQETYSSFSASTTGTWSSYSQWTLTPSQLPHVVDKLTLALTLGAGSVTGSGAASNVSLVNDAAFLSKLVEVRIGSQLLASLYPENSYVQPVIHMTTEEKALYLPVVGNASLATRRTNTAAGQTLYWDIPVPFITAKGWLTAQHPFNFDIKVFHNDLTSIVQTTGTSPVLPISSVVLNVSGRNYLSQQNAVNAVMNQRRLGPAHQRFLDPVQQQFTLASGSSQYTVQLTNVTGMVSHLLFLVRAQSSVGTPLGNTPDALLQCTSFSFLDSAGNIIIPQTSSAYALANYSAKYFIGDFTDIASGLGPSGTQKNIYSVVFDRTPKDALKLGTQEGFKYLDGLAKLQINFASATSSTYLVDVIAYVWSNITVDAGGNVTKSLVTAA